MKKFIISFAIVLFFGSLMGANAFAGNNESDRISNVIPEMSPGAMTPPPGDAIDILVEAGYMTLAESKVIWNFYYSGGENGEQGFWGALVKLAQRIGGKREVQVAVLGAFERLVEWACENGCSGGGGGLPLHSDHRQYPY
jgi:hypothetical protein